jgi:hypothetical protein
MKSKGAVFVRGARARAAASAEIVVGAALVVVIALTACKTTEDQASRPDESAELARPESNEPLQPAPPVDPPVVAPPDSPREAKQVPRAEPSSRTGVDPFAGVEEWVARGPGDAARLLSPGASSAVAFDAYDGSGAGDGMALESETSLDRYDRFGETGFVAVRDRPLSTFSIDVDTASYSNLRRFLQEGDEAAGGRGPDRGDAELLPLCHRRADPGALRRPAHRGRRGDLRRALGARTTDSSEWPSPGAESRTRRSPPGTSSCWSTCPDRWTDRTGCPGSSAG